MSKLCGSREDENKWEVSSFGDESNYFGVQYSSLLHSTNFMLDMSSQ
jgi:hypothetical protein